MTSVQYWQSMMCSRKKTQQHFKRSTLRGGPFLVKTKNHRNCIYRYSRFWMPTSFSMHKGPKNCFNQSKLPKGINFQKNSSHNLSWYNGLYIEPLGSFIFKQGSWTVNSAPFLTVEGQRVNIVGRNILSKIGIKLYQEKQIPQMVLNIKQKSEASPEKKSTMGQKTAQGVLYTNRMIKKPCHNHRFCRKIQGSTTKRKESPHSPSWKGGTRDEQTDRTKSYEKVGEMHFVSPIVIMLKKDQLLKLALNSR